MQKPSFLDQSPQLESKPIPNLPEKLEFFHAEEILEMYPELPRKQRETAILQEHPAIFIIDIGSVLKDGYPHEMRAADYDDWITDTSKESGKQTYGLNGDILVWNPVTQRRHELSSMGIRVTPETLKKQLELSGQTDFLNLPYQGERSAASASSAHHSLSPGPAQSRAPAQSTGR